MAMRGATAGGGRGNAKTQIHTELYSFVRVKKPFSAVSA